MTRASAWALLVVLIAVAARAQSAQRALLPVVVNGTSRGDVLSLIEGEDVFVPKTFIEEMTLPLQKAKTRMIEGDVYVSLRSLAPNLTFQIDPADVVLMLTVDPRFLGKRVVSLQKTAGVLDRGGDPSMFVNYSVTGQTRHTPAFFGEFGANRGNELLYSGFSHSQQSGFLRGLTYLNIDTPSRMQRWTAGDAFVGTDILGGSVAIGGLTLSREYSLQPYFIRSPSLDVTGTALTPSTVDVYVNGQLTNRISVPAGVFTLHDLPATGGLGDTQLVIRDAFGRETTQQASYYYSTNVLRKGFSEYEFSAGAVRRDFSRSFAYDGPGTLAQYRRGLTDNFTLGGRFEADRHIVSGGPRVTVSTRFGDFDLNGAASSDHSQSGTAGAFAYRFTAPRFSFGASAIQRSDFYSTLSMPASVDRNVHELNGFASAIVGIVSVGVVANRTDTRSGLRYQRVALESNTPLGRWGNLFTSVGRVQQNGKTDPEVMLGLTVSLGYDTTANVLAERTEGRDGARVEVRKPLTMANGLGYALQSDSLLDQRFAELDYQSSYGRYQVTADPRHSDQATYLIAGGLVTIGRDFLFSRPVDNSYALARVGVPRVKVFASNQEVGRTTSGGDLLIPNLLPHYMNLLRIDDKDIPIDYEIEGTELTVVPPSRGGVVANFPVHKLRSYTGQMRFMIIERPFVPALGQLEIRRGDQTETLSLGRNGEFYVEDLSPGAYPARLRVGKVHCDFRLVLPETQQASTDLGVIKCAP